MRRTAVRLACVLVGVVVPLLVAPAAGAAPGHGPEWKLRETSPSSSAAWAGPHGRKLS